MSINKYFSPNRIKKMRTAAIIAEFNPFHNGHKYLLDFVKKNTSVDNVLIIMSGDFTQRGIPAVYDKFSRAEKAVINGADAVFELPAIYATSSDEDFAFGSVLLAHAAGATDLFFGSECGDKDLLLNAANNLINESSDFSMNVKAAMKSGLSYPAAMQQAAKGTGYEALLSSPNDTLALEYVKTVLKLGLNISIHAVKRIGNAHDAECSVSENGIIYESASSIRERMKNENTGIFPDDFSLLLSNRLSEMSLEDISKILSVSDSDANRLNGLKNKAVSFTELAGMLSHRQRTVSASSRILSHVLLGIKKTDLFNEDGSKKRPEYLRLLAMRSNSPIMREISDNGKPPLITKVADFDLSASKMLQTDISAANLYNRVKAFKTGEEFKSDIISTPGVVKF